MAGIYSQTVPTISTTSAAHTDVRGQGGSYPTGVAW